MMNMGKLAAGILLALAVVFSAGMAGAIVDTTPPVITDDYAYNGTWVTSTQTITFSPSDAESGVNYVKYCHGPGCNPSDGDVLDSPYQHIYSSENLNFILKYQAWDNAGNPSLIGQINVKMDLVAPITQTTGIPTGWVNHSVNVTITGCDLFADSCKTGIPGQDFSGLNATYYCVDKNNTCTPGEIVTNPVVISSNGTNYLRYYSSDLAGNKESVQSEIVNISLDDIDITAPVVAFNDLATNDSTPALTGTVDDTTADVSIDFGSGFAAAVNNGDGTWTYQVGSAMADGWYNISVKAVDSAGNEGTDEGTLAIDATAPEVAIESPLNQTYNANSISVVVALNENGSCEYSIDNGSTRSVLVYDNATGKHNALMTGLANGAYTLNVYCNDSFGNRNDTQSAEFSVSVSGGDGNGGGGGGGGGGGSCHENWTCGNWSSCVNGTQTRTCTDSKSCRTILNRPILTQACIILPKSQESIPAEPAQTPAPTGLAAITGAMIGAFGSGWFWAVLFIAVVFGVAVFLRLRK